MKDSKRIEAPAALIGLRSNSRSGALIAMVIKAPNLDVRIYRSWEMRGGDIRRVLAQRDYEAEGRS